MTIVKGKTKKLILLSLILALCVCAFLFTVPAGAASDVYVPANVLIPETNRTISSSGSLAFAGNSVTTDSNGLNLKSNISATGISTAYTYVFTYKYFKQVKANEFFLTFSLDQNMAANTNEFFSVLVEDGAGNKVEWKYTYSSVSIAVNGSGYGGVTHGITGYAWLRIRERAGGGYEAVAEAPSYGVNKERTAQITSTLPNAMINVTITHSIVSDRNIARSQSTTLQQINGAMLNSGSTESGIKDSVTPTVSIIPDVSPSYVSYGTGAEANIIKLRAGESNDLTFALSIYDILTRDEDVTLVVEDLFNGKKYLQYKNTFTSSYKFNPLKEFGNILSVGRHELTIGVLKRNGRSDSRPFLIDVLTPAGNAIVKPQIDMGTVPSKIEYYSDISVGNFSAKDFLGHDVSSVRLAITDPNGTLVNIQNRTYQPVLAGTYTYTFTATDDFGNIEVATHTATCEKTTSPTVSTESLKTSKIYYKENTFNINDNYRLHDATEAKVLFDDVDDGKNLTVTILVQKLKNSIWVDFSYSHSFVPDENVQYQIIYTATDLANHKVSRTFPLTVVNRNESPVLDLQGFSFPQTMLYRPTYTAANRLRITAEDLRGAIKDFNRATCEITLEIKRYNGDNLVNLTTGEYSTTTGDFTPATKDGRYLFSFTVTNSADKSISVSYALLVYSHKPVFNSGLTTFERAMPQSIALYRTGTLPEMLSAYITDDYNSTITFDVSVKNPAGEVVTGIYNKETRVLTPTTEGWYTITYTATNIAGNSVSVSFTVQVIAWLPEFVNLNNFNMPENARFYLIENYTAITATKIPKMTKDFIWDYYGESSVTFAVDVYKLNSEGQLVRVTDPEEFKESEAGAEYDLFYPRQTGLYTFVYTATNIAGKSTTLTLNLLVIAFAPEFKNLATFSASMPETYLFYKDYSVTGRAKEIPEFRKDRFVNDPDLLSVSVDIDIRKPDGTAATRGAGKEYDLDTRLFKPVTTGHYVFTYIVTNGAGEKISTSYVVVVYAYTPSFKTSFTIPSSARYNVETAIPLLTSDLIVDQYGVIPGPIVPSVRNKFDEFAQGAPANYEYTYDLTGGKFTPGDKGLYTFTYTVENAGGQTASITFNIYVTMASPVVDFKISGVSKPDFWENRKTVECGSTITLPKAEAADEMGKPISGSSFTAFFQNPDSTATYTLNKDEHTMKFEILGTYVFIYSALDSTGNETLVIYTVKCVDTVNPVITVKDTLKTEYLIDNVYDADNAAHNVTLRPYGLNLGWHAIDPITVGGTQDGGSGIASLNYPIKILCPKYPQTGWPANAQGNYVIPLVKGNEGIYNVIYEVVDKAGNKATLYYTFTIKMPPQVIRPYLPETQLGNTTLSLPVPALFNNWTGSGFKVYCHISDPETVITEIDMSVAGPKSITLTKPGDYRIRYYAKNNDNIESEYEVFTVTSTRGDPTFTEATRQAIYNEIARLANNGVSINWWYNFPAVTVRDAFGLSDQYEVKMKMDYTNADGPQSQIIPLESRIEEGATVTVYRVMFRDEAIYKISFIAYDKTTGLPVRDGLGQVISFNDMIRVSGSGEISFRYQGEPFPGFTEKDDRFDLIKNPNGVIGYTKYVMPASGTRNIKIVLWKITAQGRINGKITYPGVMVYVFGPGSTIDDDGLRFMDAIEVKIRDIDPDPEFYAYEIGWYTILYEAKDENGNMLRIQYKLKVVDEAAPVFSDISALTTTLTNTTKNSEVSKTLSLPMPIARDNYDSTSDLVITAYITGPNGFSMLLSAEEGFHFTPIYDGEHKITYTVMDLSGNTSLPLEFKFNVIPEVPSQTPILGIAIGGVAGLVLMALVVYFIVYKNVFKIKKLLPN